MRSVGQQLRQAREAQKRTLEDLNSSTRISIKNLQAIEADELLSISSAFLYKSFVKQFAEALGLDYRQLDPDVRTAASQMPTPLMPGEAATSAPKLAALPMHRKKGFRLLYSLSSFALVLVACSGIYGVWQRSRLASPLSWKALADKAHALKLGSKAEELPRPTTRISDTAAPDLLPKPDSSTGSAQTHDADRSTNSFTVELSAIEPAWLSIVADGKQSFKGILGKAQTKILEGHNTARIRTGNAGGVTVVFNGKPLGAMGPRGQIRTVVFTTNDYEVLDAPARIATVGFNRIAGLKWPRQQPLLLFPDL